MGEVARDEWPWMSESEHGKPRAAAPRITDEEKVMTITNQTDMSQTQAEDRMSVEEWLAIRKEAALKIDPENAEVFQDCVNLCDPYGVDPDPPEVCLGKVHFARSPESDVWVWFGDLPKATCDWLHERMENDATTPSNHPDSVLSTCSI